MRALVVYESIFGNTRTIAEAIAAGLRGGLDVEVAEAAAAPARVADVDLVVVGGPTHAWSMSRSFTRSGAREQARRLGKEPVSNGVGVREWLRQLVRPPRGRAAAAFDTAIRPKGRFPGGSAAMHEACRLADHGYRVIAGPEQFFVVGVDGPLAVGEVDRARDWGARLAVLLRSPETAGWSRLPGRTALAAATLGNAVALAAINLHALWRPWTGGLVTAEWVRVVPFLDVACVVAVAGNLALLASRTHVRVRVVDVCTAVATLVGASAMLHVFPFEFAEVPWLAVVMRVLLWIGLIVGVFGLVGRAARLLALR